ncbi:acyltransferase family protein [Pseudomonas multiresinivorans]|uniref:Acyltransferase n=1 Tax=Pseudomonas multiresinivorans TaxID=95301 RepID=A0A7Z3GQW4_9PSED|nr:acyltransferase [Pseudomonas multiresinivorans]QJP09049.1 acyltransferase [Pseudomonas multiresinivorans]
MSNARLKGQYSGFIPEYEGLRGILAIWVVIGHVMSGLPISFNFASPSLWNTVPVQVFIILSGFVIFSLLDREHQNYRKFLTQRAFRIFPIYLVALIISTLMLPISREILQLAPTAPMTEARISLIDSAEKNLVWSFLSHALLIQGLVPDRILENSAYTLVGQAWSVSVEWQFYLLAPAAYFLLGRTKRIAKLIVLSAGLIILAITGRSMGGGYIGNYLPLFAVGIATFYTYKLSSEKWPAALIPALLAAPITPEHSAALIIWALVSYCALCKKTSTAQQAASSLLRSKPAVYLGQISYSIYILHMILVITAIYVASKIHAPTPFDAAIAISLSVTLTILFSHASYKYIENPMMRTGKWLTNTKQTEVATQ